jgi:hypothetical protein
MSGDANCGAQVGALAVVHRAIAAFTGADAAQWYYTGVRLAASLPGMGDADAIAARLDLPRGVVQGVLAFLMVVGLLERDTGGYRSIAKRTHWGPSSPFAARHHKNWRPRAMRRYESTTARDFAFTSPRGCPA